MTRAGAGQRGAALILALLCLALVAAILVEVTLSVSSLTARTRNRVWHEQHYQHLLGAEARTVQRLQRWTVEHRNRPTAVLHRLNAQYALPEGGHVRVTVHDWQGRFNLNALAVGTQTGKEGALLFPFTVHQRRFVRLLQALPEQPFSQAAAIELAATLTDWIDADHRSVRDGSTEFSGKEEDHPPNKPLISLAQLREVPGMSDALFRALKPHVMVWSATEIAINLNAATQPLLRALPEFNGLYPAEAYALEPLVLWQQTQGFASLEEFRRVSGWTGNALDASHLSVHGSVYAIESRLEQAEQVATLFSQVRRLGQGWRLVTVWRNPYGY